MGGALDPHLWCSPTAAKVHHTHQRNTANEWRPASNTHHAPRVDKTNVHLLPCSYASVNPTHPDKKSGGQTVVGPEGGGRWEQQGSLGSPWGVPTPCRTEGGRISPSYLVLSWNPRCWDPPPPHWQVTQCRKEIYPPGGEGPGPAQNLENQGWLADPSSWTVAWGRTGCLNNEKTPKNMQIMNQIVKTCKKYETERHRELANGVNWV